MYSLSRALIIYATPTDVIQESLHKEALKQMHKERMQQMQQLQQEVCIRFASVRTNYCLVG